MFKHVNYIMLFFDDLHNRHKKGDNEKEAVKRIMNDYELFSAELTTKLEQMCDDYFGLHTRDDGEDDECEW